jgi:hypothetical protein
VNAQECVEELDKELTQEADVDGRSEHKDGSGLVKAQTWLEKLQENMQISAPKASKGTAEEQLSHLSFCRQGFVFDCVVLSPLP